MVGTPRNTVTRSLATMVSACSPSNFGSRVRHAPPAIAAFSPTVCPNEWNSGRPPKTTSPGAIGSRVSSGGRHIAAQVGVAQLGSLRLAGGARGVQDHRGVLGGLARRPCRWARRRPVPARSRRASVTITWVPVTPAAFCASSANSGKTTATLAPAVLPGEGDLAGLQQRVHRHHDRPEPQDRVVDDREVADVGHDHGHPVPGGDAALGQDGREAGRGPVQRGVGEDLLALLDGRQARIARRPVADPVGNVGRRCHGSDSMSGMNSRGRVGPDGLESPTVPPLPTRNGCHVPVRPQS